MRPGARLAFALTLSALLHGVWLVLPSHTRVGHRTAAPQRMDVRMVRTAKLTSDVHIPALPAPDIPPPEPLPLETPAEPDTPPSWINQLPLGDDPVYYSRSEVDQPSRPIQDIDIPEDFGAALQQGRAVLEVRIDEFGTVNDVTVQSAQPATLKLDKAIETFKHASFMPAMRNGRFVKSRKSIEICFGPCDGSAPMNYPDKASLDAMHR